METDRDLHFPSVLHGLFDGCGVALQQECLLLRDFEGFERVGHRLCSGPEFFWVFRR